MKPPTEWFIYCQRERTELYPHATRKAIVAGPYPSREAADARHMAAVRAVEQQVRGGRVLLVLDVGRMRGRGRYAARAIGHRLGGTET